MVPKAIKRSNVLGVEVYIRNFLNEDLVFGLVSECVPMVCLFSYPLCSPCLLTP